jgi:hypothetical protein
VSNQNGANDFLTKPLDFNLLRKLKTSWNVAKILVVDDRFRNAGETEIWEKNSENTYEFIFARNGGSTSERYTNIPTWISFSVTLICQLWMGLHY